MFLGSSRVSPPPPTQVGLPLRGKVEEEEEEERNSLGSLQVGGGGGVGSTYRSSSPPFHSGSSPQKREEKTMRKNPFPFPWYRLKKEQRAGKKLRKFYWGGQYMFPHKNQRERT